MTDKGSPPPLVSLTTGKAPIVPRGVPVEQRFAPAPTNYVAGLGRGATGFTTRSDIGPARTPSAPPVANFGQAPADYVPGAGRGAIGFGLTGTVAPGVPVKRDEDTDRGDYSDAQFDQWSGFDGSGLFNGDVYDAEDREADRIWEQVDKRMDSRRQKRREEKEREMLEKYRNERPKIQAQFADLKRNLAEVSADEWSNIPEIGDYTIKRRKVESFTPLPDQYLVQASQQNVLSATEQDVAGTSTDLRALGELRGILVKSQLQKAEDDVMGKTTINPKAYMTGIQSMNVLGEAEIGDYRKARELLVNITQTNPTHSPGWVALARVEELAGKVRSARQAILQACENCPESEDVWLEAIRLHPPNLAKSLIARAVQHLPHSVNVWLAAADLEETPKAKRKVLQKALLTIPNSVKLWKEAIELEDDEENAKVLLARAVECIPQSVDLWLALARLETYQNAKKLLNKAHKAIPTEPMLWIAAAELEESNMDVNSEADMIEKIIKNAIKSLTAHKVDISRDDWIKKYAYASEERGQLRTCRALIRNVIGIGVETADLKHTWIADAKQAIDSNHIETARAIYAHALTQLPQKKGLWLRAAQLEREHGNREQLLDLLAKAVSFCPNAEQLWLVYAKEQWLAGDLEKTRLVLAEAFKVNKQSEEIWLAAVKLETEHKEYSRARVLLEAARQQANTARVWMKSAVLERNLVILGVSDDKTREKTILDEALKILPKAADTDEYAKLWMMRGQYEERITGDYKEARNIYERGLKYCQKSVPLWLCAAKLEVEKLNNIAKARALLEKARLSVGPTHPNRGELWRAAIRVENYAHFQQSEKIRTGAVSITDVVSNMGQTLLAKALQDVPQSGDVWAMSIDMEPRAKQRTQGMRALQSCDKDPIVTGILAKLFWKDRKLENARRWLHRALSLDKDNGDSWIYAYKYELEHGTEQSRRDLKEQFVQADPHHGELWCSLRKEQLWEVTMSVRDMLEKAATQLDINDYAPLYTLTTYVAPEQEQQIESVKAG